MEKPLVIILCGPTASGKTSFSIELAKQIQGEIVSADSMQIYQEMDIGTAKVTEEEKQNIPHYMIDIIKPNERYSVAEYKEEATKAIENILAKGKVPIVVGGTGLYINSLLYNITYPQLDFDKAYRTELETRVEKEGLESLYQEACHIDQEAMQKISQNDKKRILRVIEIYHQTGKTKTELEKESRKEKSPFNFHVYVLSRDREELYQRINLRVDKMIQDGLIEEVRRIKEKYQEFPTAMQGLGYKEVVSYLQGNMTKEEMVETIKKESRRYAKRQITWFKAIKEAVWLDMQKKVQENIDKILEDE